jgi:O-antigen ligase
VLALVWAFQRDHQITRRFTWRLPVALSLVLLFLLMILGSGSRAGLLLGGIGLCLGLGIVQGEVRRGLSRYPRWVFPAVLGGGIGVVAILVIASLVADRAVSINRILDNDGVQDMRRRALPTVVDMVREYFPVGSGMGGFDPIFRIHEPFNLLKLTFFNHAHNDIIEIVLDAGLIGGLALFAALVWWTRESFHAWREAGNGLLPRLGSSILLLIGVASLFDYPARTPLIMAVVVIAAVWLGSGLADQNQKVKGASVGKKTVER